MDPVRSGVPPDGPSGPWDDLTEDGQPWILDVLHLRHTQMVTMGYRWNP